MQNPTGQAAVETHEPEKSSRFRPQLTRPRRRALAATLALSCIVASLATSGHVLREHHTVVQQDRDRAEFTAAARQAVVTLLSIDSDQAHADVQRIIDNSTGPFQEDLAYAADDFVRMAQDARATTDATAKAAAVESMSEDSAVVLVTAASTVTTADGVTDAPQNWRLSVELQRAGDEIKMSKVEFVP
ncbi:hypothetical protein [Mycolicibacterium thermoresistibile]